MIEFNDHLARGRATCQRQRDLPEGVPASAARLSHTQQAAYAALVARAPGPHTLAHPGFFLDQTLIKLLSLGLLHRQQLLLLGAIGSPIARKAPELATVQFDNTSCQTIQEHPVVRHKHERPWETRQVLFQPINGLQVQVIGGFVEQEHLRIAHQGLRQGHAPLPATGELTEPRLRRELQASQHHLHLRLQAPTVTVLQVRLEVV